MKIQPVEKVPRRMVALRLAVPVAEHLRTVALAAGLSQTAVLEMLISDASVARSGKLKAGGR